MDERTYVPILLGRRGELLALRDCSVQLHQAFTPLFVIPPVPWDYTNEQPAETLDQHLHSIPRELFQARGARHAFVDLILVDDDGPLASGVHPLVWLTQECGNLGLQLIPTVSTQRSAAYVAAVTTVIARDQLGVCVRLPVSEWPSNAGEDLDALLQQLGATRADADLILDLRDDAGQMGFTAVRTELASLPQMDEWRSVIVVGGGMPQQMPSGQGVFTLQRKEWIGYQGVVANPPSARRPSFGDYAIAHPEPLLDLDPRLMSLSATIRYTANDEWLVAKGPLWKGVAGRGLGGAAMQPAAQQLVANAAYLGAGHCSSEVWIDGAATGGSGGNPMTWRKVGTRHHLQRVVEQIASLF